MTKPLKLINVFSIPADQVDDFVNGWEHSTKALASAPGFRGTRLHRALTEDAEFQIINIAQWDSIEQWQAAMASFQGGESRRDQSAPSPVVPHPAFYRVVSSTPDPTAPTDSAATS